MMERITKYGLLVVKNNKILLNKEKKHEQLLMPGGKPKSGETPEECIARELKEELSVEVKLETLRHLGRFEDIAAGRKAIITMDLYKGEIKGTPKPQPGVERVVWFGKRSQIKRLSPIIRNKIWPYLLATKVVE